MWGLSPGLDLQQKDLFSQLLGVLPLVPILLPELSLPEEGHLVMSPSQGKGHQLLTQDGSGGPSPPWVLI